MHWLQFIISSVVIIFAGVSLTQYADKLCDTIQIGRVWIGIVLLGLITSLPEAITSLVAVTTLSAADLAVGNLLGSNTFNPLLIVVMDIVYRQGAVTDQVHPNQSHKAAALFTIGLTLIVMAEIYLAQSMSMQIFGPISYGTLLIAGLYIWGMQQLRALSAATHPPTQQETKESISLAKIYLNLGISAFVVVVAAYWLTQSADVIAESTGLGQSFVGTIFLAFVTSLPEMVVTISALKLGSIDLAVGNIFGSNMANIFIVFLCSLFYSNGPLLADVSNTHIFTGVVGIIMISVVALGIYNKDKKTILGVGWDSGVILSVFLIGHFLTYYNVLWR